ncbi:MAG TPA: hydroxymethylglutaryl-CoA lyase [Chroococcales cyanobacterium]
MLDKLPTDVKIVEVGPRDGLQNEEKLVPTGDKVRLIEALAASGLKNIEVTSFVSPKWIPQLADGIEVVQSLSLPDSVNISALVPNLKGYESAVKAKIKNIALFLSASESHSKKNINKSIDEALSTMKEVAQQAKHDGRNLRCYVSVVFACPYEGKIAPEKVAAITEQLLAMGVDEISLGDTIGHAIPNQVIELTKILSRQAPLSKFALHFHDTLGMALANVLAGIDSGITIFDASVGGMGGCPYAPGAAGNLATEDLIHMLDGLGIRSGVDLEKLVDAGVIAEEITGKQLPGRYLKACLAGRSKQERSAASPASASETAKASA